MTTGNGTEQTIARQITPHFGTRYTPRGTASSIQIGQSLAIGLEHLALRIDVQAALGVKQSAGHLDGVKRRF
jgi:hypothetical protein